jgi:phage-related minor tail protein
MAMSDTSDLDAAAAALDRMNVKTTELTATAAKFSTTMTQAFSNSAASGSKFETVLMSLMQKMSGVLTNAVTPMLSGGVSSVVSQMISSLAGGAGASGTVKAFASGGVIGTPSYFPMAGNDVGLAGEAGPEAIMPLQRAADGSLGVAAQGGGNTIHVQIATPDVEGFRRSESYVTGQIARAVARGQRSL